MYEDILVMYIVNLLLKCVIITSTIIICVYVRTFKYSYFLCGIKIKIVLYLSSVLYKKYSMVVNKYSIGALISLQ